MGRVGYKIVLCLPLWADAEVADTVSRPRIRWAFCISDKNEGFGASDDAGLEEFVGATFWNVREVEVTVTTEPTYPLSESGVFSRVSSQLSTYKKKIFFLT